MAEEFVNEAPEELPEEQGRPGRELYEWLQMVLGCVLVAVLVFNCFARLTRVDGGSMDNTLEDGELMLVWSLGYQPKHGDIVVLNKTTTIFPGHSESKAIVKRVIATENQTVDIDFEEGIVYVDGTPLDEPYTYTDTNISEGMVFPLTVEEGCVFLMGDNRNESMDSRDPEIGMVDEREILGKAVFLLLPGEGTWKHPAERNFSRIGGLSNG